MIQETILSIFSIIFKNKSALNFQKIHDLAEIENENIKPKTSKEDQNKEDLEIKPNTGLDTKQNISKKNNVLKFGSAMKRQLSTRKKNGITKFSGNKIAKKSIFNIEERIIDRKQDNGTGEVITSPVKFKIRKSELQKQNEKNNLN